MLDEIRGRVDDAGNQNLVVGNLDLLEVLPFVIVARVRRLDNRAGAGGRALNTISIIFRSGRS